MNFFNNEHRLIAEAYSSKVFDSKAYKGVRGVTFALNNVGYYFHPDLEYTKLRADDLGFIPLTKRHVETKGYSSFTVDGSIIAYHRFLSALYLDNYFDLHTAYTIGRICEKSVQINHMVVTEGDGEYYNKGIRHGSQVSQRRGSIPHPETLYDARYFEPCNNKENTQHINFINRYALYDLRISALDLVDILESPKYRPVRPEDFFYALDWNEITKINQSLVLLYYIRKFDINSLPKMKLYFGNNKEVQSIQDNWLKGFTEVVDDLENKLLVAIERGASI